jgi:hypothetical protein
MLIRMLIRCLVVAVVFSSQTAIAMTLTLEPDDFASGTNLSSASFSYVSLSTTRGAPVYSASIAITGEALPARISDHLVFNVAPVPEPGTIALLAFGLAGLPLACRRHAKERRTE